jgi:hypothetical protein
MPRDRSRAVSLPYTDLVFHKSTTPCDGAMTSRRFSLRKPAGAIDAKRMIVTTSRIAKAVSSQTES